MKLLKGAINMNYEKKVRPDKIIQFGEGGFLRGFVDWIFQIANDKEIFNGNAVVVQPIEKGMCDMLSAQNCVYTHVTRGLSNGKAVVDKKIIDMISRCVNPYENYEDYLKLAENPDFRFIVSNTTESGIVYRKGDKLEDAPAVSFPAKLTALLNKRYNLGLKGFIFLPCELINKNGETLKEIILQYADDWKLGDGFKAWIENDNIF